MVCCLALGIDALPRPWPAESNAPASEAAASPSVTCMPFGLYGDITTRPLVDRLSDGGDNLTFVGTTNGLYVVASGGRLQHFLYSPFGIRHIALIDDTTGDGTREVVVALNDTQVPALRCYDGASWEEVWRFAPMARIWDRLWVDRQSIITNLEVTGEGDSMGLLLTTGRCVLSVHAADGAEQWRFTASSALWRMVTLADLDGDGSDEVLAGCNGGDLIWLEAATGRKEWQTRLPEHENAGSGAVSHLLSDIAVLDEGEGLLATASGDGSVQMFDLRARKLMWDTLAFKDTGSNPYMSDSVLLSPTADVSGDGLGELLLSQGPDAGSYPGGDTYSGYATSGGRALCDSTGQVVWQTDSSGEESLVRPGMAFETGVFEGQPVFLDRAAYAESGAELEMVDVRDGQSVLHAVPLNAIQGHSIVVKQPAGDGYLAFSSSSDLAAISATGDLLWHYPRITIVMAERGSFVGNGTEDVLLLCGSDAGQNPGQEPVVRMLRMMDGATGAVVWSYEVPHAEWVRGGGLRSLQLTGDLAGSDGVQDIAGCRGDRAFIFSGRDGAVSSFDAGQAVSSLEVIRHGANGTAFALTTSDSAGQGYGYAAGLLILDQAGEPLWSTATAAWLGEESGSFLTLDDINSDNASDLAVFSGSRILVLGSTDNASGYDLWQTILPENGFSIRLPELVGDSDGDGLRELAYLQESSSESRESGGGFYESGPSHLLCVQSLEDRRSLVRADLQGTIRGYDLACGDFNADGVSDSVVRVLEALGSEDGYPGYRTCSRILSGKDGALIWEEATGEEGWGFSYSDGGVVFGSLLAMNAGDINGDGADELASVSGVMEGRQYGGTLRQQRLQVFDVVHDTLLKDIAATPLLQDDSGAIVDGGVDSAMQLANAGADGHGVAFMAVGEPSLPTYDPDASALFEGTGSPRHIALIDLESGRRLCAFTGFDPAGVSVLGSRIPGTLTVAACGGLCSLHLDADLLVTSPEDGANTGPTVGVSWESPSGGMSQVFVDGVRNDITNGFKSDLYLGGGKHEVVVRSVDDWGRVSYGPADLDAPVTIGVGPSPWKPAWLVLGLFALVAVVLALLYPRLHRAWRARRLPHGGSNGH